MSKIFINNTGERAWWVAKQDDNSIIRYWYCEDGTQTVTGLDAIVGYFTEQGWFDELENLGEPVPPPNYP